MKLVYSYYDSPVGRIYAAATGAGICDVSIRTGASSFLARLEKRHALAPVEDRAPFSELFKLFDSYFRGLRVDFSAIPVDTAGTGFDRRVWRALMKIPFGEVRTYKEVAAMIGRPEAARAVGGACARNPVPVVVPCHRVLSSSGGLGGYSCGTDIKRYLLELEGLRV